MAVNYKTWIYIYIYIASNLSLKWLTFQLITDRLNSSKQTGSHHNARQYSTLDGGCPLSYKRFLKMPVHFAAESISHILSLISDFDIPIYRRIDF